MKAEATPEHKWGIYGARAKCKRKRGTKVMFSLNENVRGLNTWLFKDPESWVGQKFMFIISSPQYVCAQSI